MTASSFENCGEGGSIHTAGISREMPEEPIPPYCGEVGTENVVARAASFTEENRACKTDLLKLEAAIYRDLLGTDAVSTDSLEAAAGNGSSAFSSAAQRLPARATHSEAVSWTADSAGQEEGAEETVYGNTGRTTADEPLSKRNDASDMHDLQCPSRHVVVDIQVLQALQERLLYSEEKLWLTQRQLVDEQGKEVHLKNQILYLENEVERAQAEGLATASRYVEQAEYLEESRDKLNRLTEENESLESYLSEKISEGPEESYSREAHHVMFKFGPRHSQGRALQELAERLILRLGNKTNALLEEGLRVTRVLSIAWNKEDLLAELEKNNLLQLQLARVALLYCKNKTTKKHNDTTAEIPFLSDAGGTAPPESTGSSLQLHPELLPYAGSEALTDCSLSVSAVSESQTEASLFNVPTAPGSGDSPPDFSSIASASRRSRVHAPERSFLAPGREAVHPKVICVPSRGHITGISSAITPAKALVVAPSASHHPPQCSDPVEAAQPFCVSGDRITSQAAIQSSPACREEEDETPPSSPSHISTYSLGISHIVRREGDVSGASTADQSSLGSSGSSQELEDGIVIPGEIRKPLASAEDSSSSLQGQGGVLVADHHSLRATSRTINVSEEATAPGSDVMSTSRGMHGQRDALDDSRISVIGEKLVTSCQASHMTVTRKTEGASESIRCFRPEASGSSSHALGLRGAPAVTRSASLQRVQSEAWRLGPVSKQTPRSLPVSRPAQENIRTDTIETGRKAAAVSAYRERDVDKASTHASQGRANRKSNIQDVHQIEKHFTFSAGELQRRHSYKASIASGCDPGRYCRSKSHAGLSRESKKETHLSVPSSKECTSPFSVADVGDSAQYGENNRETCRPSNSSNIHHTPHLQAPPFSAPSEARAMPCSRFDRAVAAPHSGSNNGLARKEMAVITKLNRGSALLRASSVKTIALAGGEKTSLSPRAPHGAGMKNENISPQETSRTTARTACPPPRGGASTALRTRIPSLPALNASSQKRQKEQRKGQLTPSHCTVASSKTQLSSEEARSAGDANSGIETQGTSVEIATTAYEAAAAMTMLSEGRAIHTDKENKNCRSKQDTKGLCKILSLYNPPEFAQVDSHFHTNVAPMGPSSGTVQQAAQVQNSSESEDPQPDNCAGRVAHVQPPPTICETEYINEFHVPLNFPSAVPEEPLQTFHQGNTELKGDQPEGHQMMSFLGMSVSGGEASHVSEAPSEVQGNNCGSSSVVCKRGPALSTLAGSENFPQEKEVPGVFFGPLRDRITDQQRNLPDLPGEDTTGFLRARNTIPAAQKTHLPPLPPTDQSELAPNGQQPVLHTDVPGSPSSSSLPPVFSQNFRCSAERNVSRRDSCAADVDPCPASNPTSTSVDPTTRNTHLASLEREYSQRTLSRTPEKTDKDTLGSTELVNHYILGDKTCDVLKPNRCASPYSDELVTREQSLDASSLSLDNSSPHTQQELQGRIRQGNETARKGESRALLRAVGTDQHRGSEEENKPCASRAEEHCSAPQLARTRLAKVGMSHSTPDGETPVGNALSGRGKTSFALNADPSLRRSQGATCIQNKTDEHSDDTPTFSLTCKSGISHKDTVRRTPSRRASALNIGTRSSKILTKSTDTPRYKEAEKVQVCHTRRSCAGGRRSSVSIGRTLAATTTTTMQKAASKKKPKVDEVGPDIDRSFFYDVHLKSTRFLPPASGTRGHNSRTTTCPRSGAVNRIYKKSSNIYGLVYHDMPMSGRGPQQTSGTPSNMGDKHRDTSHSSTVAGECLVSDNVRGFTASGYHEVQVTHGSLPSNLHSENSPYELMPSDKVPGNNPSEELLKREERGADDAGVFTSSPSSTTCAPTTLADAQEKSGVTGVVKTDKDCLSFVTIEQGISLLTSPNDISSDQEQQGGKSNLHSTAEADLRKHSQLDPPETLPSTPSQSSPSACVRLHSIISPPFSCPQAKFHRAPSGSVGSAADVEDLKNFSKHSGQQVNGQQQYQQQLMDDCSMTDGTPPRIGSWSSLDTVTSAHTSPPTQPGASLRMSLPATSNSTCVPDYRVRLPSSGDMVTEKLSAQDLPERKDEASRRWRESVGSTKTPLQTSSHTPAVANTDTGTPNNSVPSLQTVLTQLRLDAVPAAASGSCSPKTMLDASTTGTHTVKARMPPAFIRTSEGTRQQSAALRGTQAAAPPVQSPMTLGSGTGAGSIQGSCLQQQMPSATGAYQQAFCGTHPSLPAAAFPYRAAPPACTRSSVPLQQHYKYRTSPMQEQQQRPSAVIKSGEQPQQQQVSGRKSQLLLSQQHQQPPPQYWIDWGSRLRPQQHWHPSQIQQYQQQQVVVGQSLHPKEQQQSHQIFRNGSGQCHRDQLSYLTQQQPQQQQQQQGSREVISRTMAHQGQQQGTQAQGEMQQRQQQAAKPMEKQASCRMSPLYVRQTLPVRSAERAMGSRGMPRQQQNQPSTPQQQELVSKNLRQPPTIPPANHEQMQSEVPDQLLKCRDSSDTVGLEQQQQKQNRWDTRTCTEQQRRNTTGYPQARNGVEIGYGYHHLVNRKIPPVKPQVVRQTQVQPSHGTCHASEQQQQRLNARSQQPHGGTQQPQAGFQQQQQQSPADPHQKHESQMDSQQHIHVNSEKLNLYTHTSPNRQLQQLPAHQPACGSEKTLVQLPSGSRHVKPPLPQQQKSIPRVPQLHLVHFACEPEIQEQHLQKQQSTHLQRQLAAQQQQQQRQAMSTRWSCGVPSGCRSIQAMPKTFTFQQQGQPQMPQQWQHHEQQQQQFQQGQQQLLQNLLPQGQQHHHIQLQQQRQKQQQPMETGQLQQQQIQQQLLHRHFWNVVQMHQRGSLSACTEKDNVTGALYKVSSKPAAINCGTHTVKIRPLISDSRATISAGSNRKDVITGTMFQLPFGGTKAAPCAALPMSAAGKNFLLSKPCIPAASSLPPGVPTIQASRLSAPVFPAAAVRYPSGALWKR